MHKGRVQQRVLAVEVEINRHVDTEGHGLASGQSPCAQRQRLRAIGIWIANTLVDPACAHGVQGEVEACRLTQRDDFVDGNNVQHLGRHARDATKNVVLEPNICQRCCASVGHNKLKDRIEVLWRTAGFVAWESHINKCLFQRDARNRGFTIIVVAVKLVVRGVRYGRTITVAITIEVNLAHHVGYVDHWPRLVVLIGVRGQIWVNLSRIFDAEAVTRLQLRASRQQVSLRIAVEAAVQVDVAVRLCWRLIQAWRSKNADKTVAQQRVQIVG